MTCYSGIGSQVFLITAASSQSPDFILKFFLYHNIRLLCTEQDYGIRGLGFAGFNGYECRHIKFFVDIGDFLCLA